MQKITEKQLIASLSQLKDIKPNQEWASLLKSTLLEDKVPGRMTGAIPAQKANFIDSIALLFASKKMVYTLSAIMVLVIGLFGYVELMPTQVVPSQTASLSQSKTLNQQVAILNTQINDVVLASKNGTIKISAPVATEIKEKVSQLAKSLTDNQNQDSQTIKDIAVSLKTLASVSGTNLTENSDLKDLYQSVVKNQIKDLQNATLTEDQQKALTEVENLYNKEKYAQALEKILLISK